MPAVVTTRVGTALATCVMPPVQPGARAGLLALAKKFGVRVRTLPTSAYNCHGLTFASRRAALPDPEAVRVAIAEDQYQRVPLSAVLAGDIAVWVDSDGQVVHSGVVVGAPAGEPGLVPSHRGILVVSKWGHGAEVIHGVAECPYFQGSSMEYCRVDN